VIRSNKHIEKVLEKSVVESIFKVLDVAFDCRLATFVLDNSQYEDKNNLFTPESFMERYKNDVKHSSEISVKESSNILHLILFDKSD
jgi:hypothetical protein